MAEETGGAGNDTLTGDGTLPAGAVRGSDQFRLRTDGGTDTIIDFTKADADKIALLGGNVTGGLTFGNTTATVIGATLNAADFDSRASFAAINGATDDNQVIVITSDQSTGDITSSTSAGATNLYVVVFNNTTNKGEIWFDTDWGNTGSRVKVATLDNVTTSAQFTALALANTDFAVYNNIVAQLNPAGVAGSPINLALADPTPDDAADTVTVTLTGVPADWTLSAGVNNGNGSWTVQTSDVASLTVTTADTFTGAVALQVTETWTNADGTTGRAFVTDNVEAYASGSPIFAVSGDDNLTGSSGNDLLVFAQPIGHDTIYNFDTAHDQIDLIGYAGFTAFVDVQAHTINNDVGDAVITLGVGQSITLRGVDANSLSADDFVFDQTPVVHNSGSMVISDGAILPLSGIIENTGTIELNSTANETDLQLIQYGITLEGHGQVILSDSSENVITGTVSDVTLTNVDNTISGAGHLGDSVMILVNQGTIIATGTNSLEIDTGTNTVVNSGTLEATGSGGLVIDSNIENSGLLWAHGANITLNGNVTGSGTALMDGVATLEFGAASSANVTLDAGATGTIVLHDSFDFTGVVSGFNGDDHLDLLDMAFGAGTTASYVENQAGTGGTLSVTDGVHTANITLLGHYSADDFTITADDTFGTLLSYRDNLI